MRQAAATEVSKKRKKARSASITNSIILLRTSPPSLGRDGHSRETLGLGTQGDSGDFGVGPLGLGTSLRLWGWALQGDSGMGDSGTGHSRNTLGLGNVGRVWGWASAVLWGWALQEHSRSGHSRTAWESFPNPFCEHSW